MKFRKGWLCFGALLMLGSVFFGLASSTEAKSKVHDYSKEKTVEQLIGRHWDETEIKAQYEKFSEKLTDEKSIKGEIVSDISKADKKKITDYFDKFAGKKVEYVYTKFDQFYKVKADDDYNDLRAILEYKFKVTEKKKATEYSVLLKMARLGDKDGVKWQIYDILWQDTGVDVSDIELTQLEAPSKGEEVCVMDTDAGVIKMRLFPDQAPKAVKNWIELSKDGFYDGTPFARVIKDFVIQGGALDGSGDESKSIYDGFYEDEVDKGLYNFDGALCLGNNGPHTNGNQFYIVQNTKIDEEQLPILSLPGNVEEKYKEIGGLPELDGRYTVLGQVYEGMDVVKKIAEQETDDDDAPVSDPVKIKKITFEKVE